MAKGAATEKALGNLHAKLAAVFEKILLKYEQRLDAVDAVDPSDVEDEMLKELLDEGAMPNPAMLNAIASFLKNNEIRFDDEQVDRISALKQGLEERRAKRQNVTELSRLRVVGEDE
jgi:hypothetical protein